jgi:hypothetical protein
MIVGPFIKRFGPKRGFEIGALFGALSYLAVSQSWRGAGWWRRAVQYGGGMVIRGLGRIVALCHRSSISYQFHEHIRCLSF